MTEKKEGYLYEELLSILPDIDGVELDKSYKECGYNRVEQLKELTRYYHITRLDGGRKYKYEGIRKFPLVKIDKEALKEKEKEKEKEIERKREIARERQREYRKKILGEKAPSPDLILGARYTYKELCKIFNEKEKSGNQKIAQIGSWLLKYNFERESGSRYFLLRDVYTVPLDPEELRGRKSEYADAISKILLMMCYNKGEVHQYQVSRGENITDEESDFYEFTSSRSQLYVLLGLCKDAFIYNTYKNDPTVIQEIAEHPNLYQLFKEEVFGQCRNILESSIGTMRKRNIINATESVEFAESDANGVWKWRMADKEETNILMECKRMALIDVQCYNEPMVYREHKEDTYRLMTIKHLLDDYGIDIVAYRNSITFWAAKKVVDKFVGTIYNNEEGDIKEIRNRMIDTAMHDNNDKFLNWLDKRGGYDWDTINNQYVSPRREERGRPVSDQEWKIWDDILIEMYQGDILKAADHRELAELKDENKFFNGPLREEYNGIRKIISDNYIKLPSRIYKKESD